MFIERQLFEKLEHVFSQLSKYHMKILLGDFNAELEEDIYKPKIGKVDMKLLMIIRLE
jgi:hypothetical protein